MRVFLATDIRIRKVQGKIFLENKAYYIVKRYIDAFENVILCSRTTDITPPEEWFDMTEHIVESVTYDGFKELYSHNFSKVLEEKIKSVDLVIGRLESFPACRAFDIARKFGKPYYAELMSDPWDGYWNHSLLGKLVAPYAFFKTKQVLWNADFALYVTSHFLQSRYPCRNESVSASNVFIEDNPASMLEERIAKIQHTDFSRVVLSTAAAVNVKYKGQQYVIKAIPKLNKLGYRVKYYVLGEGSPDYLKKVAKKYNVEDQVIFTGKVSLSRVFEILDETDIYIQPSLQEGLPRSVIEAMSRGCICLGARTAGIPELLSVNCVFKRKSVNAIVKAIHEVFNEKTMIALAKDNFNKSKEYTNDVLNKRRTEYYSYVVSKLTKE